MNDDKKIAVFKEKLKIRTHRKYQRNVARLKWLVRNNITIKAIDSPYAEGSYTYYELSAPIPGEEKLRHVWHGKLGESLGVLVDGLIASEQRP